MKKSIRILSALLTFLLIMSVLVSCAETQVADVTTVEPSDTAPVAPETTLLEETTAYEPDDLKEKYDFNETVTFFIWSDHRMREYYAEDSGDNIDIAIYNRNIKVSDRLGIELKFVEEKGSLDFYKNWNQKIENDWMSDNAYDVYSGYSRAIPLLALKGLTANLLEYDDFNVEKPWWPEALTTECTIKEKLYFCSGDIATSLLWYMDAIFYNKELYDGYYIGSATPMDMVDSDEWTLDKLISLSKDIYVASPDGVAENSDYGMSVYETDIDAFQIGAGITSLEKTEDGGLRISEAWDSQRCSDVCETVGNFLQNSGVYHGDDEEARSVFFNSHSIFHLDRVLIVAGQDNTDTGKVEFEYGMVPVPKYDLSQKTYKTNLGNSFSLYAINSNSKKASVAATTFEAMASENYRSVTPAVFEVAMKVRYSSDAQTSRMYDILRNTVSFDMGRLCSAHFSNHTTKTFRNSALENPTGFLTLLKSRKAGINKGIERLMAEFEG